MPRRKNNYRNRANEESSHSHVGGCVEFVRRRHQICRKKGYPPLHIKGKLLDGGEIYLAGNISSQFISALLMVAPNMTKGLTIHLEGEVISQPYIRMTL